MNKLLRRLRAGWLGAALLLTGLTACEDPAGLESALGVDDGTLAAAYVDTITVRTSTVLTDSVVSSTSSYLLLGRYQDARLGSVTARSYLQVGQASTFTPEAGAVLDSLVLVLTPDTYRYGDTTRTQTLEVHRLQTDLRGTATYYTADSRPYDAATLGRRTFRARRPLSSLRVLLDNALGQRLLDAARLGALGTTDELLYLLPGLVLTPAATDDAALLRFAVAGSALQLYYHLSSEPDQQLSHSFELAYGPAHFYQLEADRRGSLLTALPAPRQALPSALTAEETYIQAGLGLQTRVEFPYLTDLKDLSGGIVINAATLEAEVVGSSENRYLPPPTELLPRLTDAGNHLGARFGDASGVAVTAGYQRGTSPRTGLERGLYTASLTTYCTQVLAGTLANNGILLGPASGDMVERVVLGSGRNTTAPMRLRVFFTRIKP
ncbi:DUF4270 family protein [Hymenobacter gummosus]|uniref:DUF4270 family protein n=1 Tax=Hymenobacter gummosus TaxID=1776032 RepID=A0A3S0JKK7_9BACT|nr:DUF4270 family protein [Hymenobacter gummosus]RTQ53447.1 DUF4270 family protein [Hymenobacter gummosus]